MSKLLQREGNPVFSPSRLLAAICKVAPQFKVLLSLFHCVCCKSLQRLSASACLVTNLWMHKNSAYGQAIRHSCTRHSDMLMRVVAVPAPVSICPALLFNLSILVQGGQQQDSHELFGKLIEGMLAEEVMAAKALQEQVSGLSCFSKLPGNRPRKGRSSAPGLRACCNDAVIVGSSCRAPPLKARALGLLVLHVGAKDAEGCGAPRCLSTRS